MAKKYKQYLNDSSIPLSKYAKAKRKQRLEQYVEDNQEFQMENGPEESSEACPVANDNTVNEPPVVGASKAEVEEADQNPDRSCLDGEMEHLRQQIHEDGSLTSGKLVALVLCFARRYKLSRIATGDLFKLIKATLPSAAARLIPETWYQFDLLMEDHIPDYKVHHFCPVHQIYLGNGEESYTCPIDNQEFQVSQLLESAFVVLPLRDSLQLLLESYADFLENHSPTPKFHRHQPQRKLYRATRVHFELGPLDFTLTAHPDGLWLRKTKWAYKNSSYMVQISVNEFVTSWRNRNILLHTVYHGLSSVPVETLLTPLLREINDLMTSPVAWSCFGRQMKSRFFLALVVCDTKERNQVVNCRMHGAYYGCTTCYQRGCVVGCVHVFEFREEQEIRDHSKTVSLGMEAATMNAREKELMQDHLMGVVGPSVLSTLIMTTVNILRGMPHDFFHLFPEGVMKQLLSIWISEKHIDPKKVAPRIVSLRPNLQCKRIPRNIGDFAKFQGHELLFLLLFFGFPIFQGLLPEAMYLNYCRLARVSHICLQNAVFEDEILEVDRELKRFCQEFQELYGLRQMSSNVHQLRHFALNLEDWGPASDFWTLHFETFIGYRSRRVCGTQHTAKEIARTAALDLATKVLESKIEKTPGDAASQLLERLTHPQRSAKAKTFEKTSNLSGVTCFRRAVRDSTAFQRNFPNHFRLVTKMQLPGIPSLRIFSFKCILPAGFLCSAGEDKKDVARNSSYVFTNYGRLLKVEFFVADYVARTAVNYAVGKLQETEVYHYCNLFPEFQSFVAVKSCSGWIYTQTKNLVCCAMETTCGAGTKVFAKSPNCLNCDL